MEKQTLQVQIIDEPKRDSYVDPKTGSVEVLIYNETNLCFKLDVDGYKIKISEKKFIQRQLK